MFEFPKRIRLASAVVAMSVIAAGCGGGGGSSPPPIGAGAIGPIGQTAKATFVITWPTTYTAAAARDARKPAFVSSFTASLSIAVNGGTPTVVMNPNIGSNAQMQPSTTIAVAAPVTTPNAPDTFLVNAYDAKNVLLSQNSIQFPIALDAANVVPLTLSGNLGQIACQAVGPFVSGTAPAFTLVGPAGQLRLVPEDADGAIIIGSGTIPALTLTAQTSSQATVNPAATRNVFTINVLAAGPAVAFVASGQNLAGATVSSTCNVTRVLALYVSNHGVNSIGSSASGSTGPQTASVTVYPATASGNATPVATIAGSSALLSGVQYDAVDNAGNIYVTNQGPMPGATYGPQAGYVAIYGPASNGNVAPTATIPNLNTPEGVAFDTTGKLYLVTIDSILEFGAGQTGASAPAVASTTIRGSRTDLGGCYSASVDPKFAIYVACSNALEVFPPGASGNVAPSLIEVPGNTAMSFSSQSFLGVVADAASNVYVAAANNNLSLVDMYTPAQIPPPPGPSMTASPATPVPNNIAKGTGFNEPYGLAVDQNGQYYAANFGSSSISIFANATMFATGVPTSTISGSATGLNQPYGVAVR